MNRIYRTLWSVVTQSWQAVPETAKTAGKKSKSSAGGVVASVALGFTLNGVAHAQAPPAINQLPTGGTMARGTATISQTATAQAAAMVVNQSSQRAVINWNTFNLGSAASINFVQPNAQAVTLNRVNDSNPSQIFGRITANGQVFLTNANGVYFSPTSSVDVGAITATTHSITDDNFMSGRYVFERNGATGKIVNEGNITAALGGYVALLAPEVQNAGVVVARAGTVAMAAGEVITLTVDGAGSLAGMTTTASAIAALVENKLAVLAPDGQIILSAIALDKLQAGVVKNSGSLEANSLVNKGGKIVLEGDHIVMDRNSKIEAKGRTGGGTVLVGGDWQGSGDMRQATKVTMEQGASIDASATDQGDGGKVVLWSDVHNANSLTQVEGSIKAEAGPNGGSGGQIETSGHTLQVGDLAVSAKAVNGKDGEWLLDPYDITISSAASANTAFSANTYTGTASGGTSVVNATALQTALGSGTVTVSTGAAGSAGTDVGNITVSSNLTWTTAYALTLNAAGGISGTGNIGGPVAFNQGGDSTYSGNISANSANGNISKGGAGTLTFTGAITNTGYTSINAGVWRLGSSTAIGPNSLTVYLLNGASIDLNGQTVSAKYWSVNGSGVSVAGVNVGAVTNSSATAANINFTGSGISAATSTSILADNGAINITGSLGGATTSIVTLGGATGGSINGTISSSSTTSGIQTLNKVDTGTWVFTNTNFGSNLYVNAGTLKLNSATALDPSQGGLGVFTVASGATIDLNGQSLNTSMGTKFNLSGTGVNGVGALTNSSSTAATVPSSIVLTSDATINAASGAINFTTSGAANSVTGAYRLTLAGNGGGTIANNFTAAGTSLTLQDAGTWTLSGTNNAYAGSTNITGATLKINTTAAWPASTAFTLGTGATLAFGLSGMVTLTANNGISSATPGDGTISNISATTVVNLTGANLSGYTGSYSAVVNEATVTPSIGKITLPSSPDFTHSTFNINTTGFQVALTPTQIITWSGTANGTPLLKMNGASVTSGSPVLGGMLTLNAGDVTIGPGAFWTLTNAGTTYYMGTSNSNANYTLTGTATATVYYGQAAVSTGVLSGTGALVVDASSGTAGGSLTLQGLNSYGGGTQLISGKLKAASATAFGTGDISVASGTVIDLNGQTMTSTGGLTLNGTGISSSGALMNGAATAASYAGLLTLAGPTTIVSGSSPGSIALTNTGSITGSGYALTLDGAAGGSIASSLDTGTGTVTKLNSQGTWTLSGANTYSGGTTLSAGYLKAGSATAFGTGNITETSGATLDLNGQTMTSLGTLTVNGTGAAGTYGAVRNTSATAASYAGLVVLGSATTIIAGTGSISLTNSGSITGAFGLTLDGAASGSSITSIIGTGAGTVTKIGNGTWTLSGVNTYTGGTSMSAGYLKAGNSRAFGTGNITVNSGGVLDLNGQTMTSNGNLSLNGTGVLTSGALINTSATPATYAGLVSLSGAATITGGTGTIALTNTGNMVSTGAGTWGLTLDGAAGGSIASNITTLSTLAKNGTGTWTLSGANTYNGTTTIYAGTLKAGSSTAFSSTALMEMGTSQAVDLNGQTMTSLATFTIRGTGISNNGALINSSASPASYAGPIVISTATGNTIKSDAGTITLGAISGSVPLTLDGATGGSITGIISGTGTVTKLGAGTWTLSGANTYSGATAISVGTLKAGSATAFGTGAISVTAGSALDLNGQTMTSTGTLTLNGTGISSGGALMNSSATAATYAGPLILGSTGSSIVGDTGTIALTNTGNITGTGFSLTLGGAAGGSITTNIGTGTGGTVTKEGAGTWILSGASSNFTGAVTINAGALRAASALALGTTAGGVTVASGATLELGGPASPGVLAIGAEALTVADGGAIHNVAGYNTYAGAMTLQGNATITIDTGTRLNFTATAAPNPLVVAAGKRLTFNTYGDLTITKALSGADANSTYLKIGSGNLSIGAGSTLASVIGVYAGLYDPTGTDYSNQYGGPFDYTVAFYNAASNGTKQTLTAGTDFSGTAVWTGAPTTTSNVGTYSLTYASGVTLSSRYYLLGATNATNWYITPKPVTISVAAPVGTYTYDKSLTYETIAGNLTTFTTNTPLVGSDTIASATSIPSVTGIAQAGNFTITPSAATVGGGGSASNYLFSYSALTVNVAKAPLTVTGTTVADKTYDRSNTATLSGGTLSGTIYAGDSLTLIPAGTFNSVDAGANVPVTAADTLGGAAASNYVLTQPTGLTATINKAHLTVTANNASKTYGDTNPALSTTVSGFVAGETLGTSGVTGAGAASTTASASTGAGTATITASAGTLAATNYDFTNLVDGTLTINKAHLTVTANNAIKTYGDANPTLSTTVSGFANGESLATSGVTGSGTATTTATALTGAGTATITAGAGTLTASNYDFTNLANGTLTIGKAHLTVTANNAIKTYGDTNPTLSATVSGFVNGESLATSGVSGAGAATTTATALTGAGTATITAGVGTLAASNYDFNTNLLNGTLTIGKANATVTANSSNVTYNGVSQSVSGFTASGLVNGELASVLTGVSTSGGTGTNAGTYPLTATGNANNYNLTFVPGNLVIGKANATVTASSSNVTYNGASQSVSGFTASGLVPGETTAVLTGVSATGASGTNAGTYASTASGTDSNYNLTFVPGSLVIGKASATVTASSGTTTYTGLSQSVSGFTATGLVPGETASVLTGVTAGASGTNAGTYASIASGTDGNYNLTFVNGSLVIGKAHLTVTANNAIKTYGDANPALSTTVSGFVNNETLLSANVTGAGAATTAATALTGAGTATITAGVGTLAASNYDFNTNLVNGTLTINKANATVTANSSNVTYNGVSQSVSGFTASGLVNGETAAVLTSVTATGASGTNADTYLTSVSGTAANYNLTFVPGSLVIGKANATVTASSGTTTYNGLTQSVSGFTASGLVHGETASVLTGVTAGGSGTDAGTYTSTASGTDRNYNLTFVNGALTINKAHLTVTASSDTRVYGDTNPTLSATLSGFVNGESASMSGSGFGTTWSVGVSANTAGITGAAAVTTAATATTGVGSVPTVAAIGTLAATNYDFTFVNGALTITKAPLSVVLGSQTKVYDGTTNASLTSNNFTLTGFVNGEGAAVTQTLGTYNSANVLNASTVTTSLAAGNFAANAGTSLNNYVLPTTASSTGSITPAHLSATGTKTYDGSINFDGTALTVAGVHGETFAATGSGTMSSKNVQTNQTLSSIAGLSLTGNGLDNYVALSTADTQVSVTPRAVNLSAPSASKTYDGTTLYQASSSDLATLSNQLVGGDRVTAAEVVYGNKDAGVGNKRVTLNTVTISDDNDGRNYTVGKLDVNNGTINKASLTVSVVSDARFVTQTDTAGYAGVVYNGLVGGETAAVLTPGTITRSNAGVGSAGQYNGVLHATNWSSNNYDISYAAGNYTIAGAHTLLVQVPTASTTYGTTATYAPTAKYLLEDTPGHFQIVTLNPTVNGNAVTVNDGVGGLATFNINAANATLSGSGNIRAGGYNLEAGSLNKTGDNFTNFVMSGGLTVTPKILSNNLNVQAITKVYDGSASISNFGLTFNQPTAGVETHDTVTLLGSGSFDDRHVGNNKSVSLSLGLSGADAANYALASPSLSANIGQITQLASVTYTGATNGNWSDANNWAGGALPDRNNVAQVVIPTGKTVVYYSDQVGTIGSTLAVNGAIRFSSSNAFTLANTVSGTGDLQQRGTGMLTVSGSNTNFSGNLDIDAYSATISNAQALGTGHVVANGGHLSVNAGLTLPSLRVDGAVILDTAIKTTGDQTYNGALTFLSSGTAQAPNFVSDSGNVSFESTVSAGLGAMTAQRALFVSAPNGTVLFNDQVGRMVQGLDYNTQYLTSGVNDTSPYALSVSAQMIKLFGDVTTFDSQTYDGAVRVGTNSSNGHTRLLVSMDPTITFKGTVDDADPTGKVNGLDVRAISLAQIASNAAVPTITFESDVGGVSPLATLRLATGIQNSATGALVTEVKTDDASRRDVHYKGDIILKGDLTVGDAPLMIAEQLLVPNASQTLTWYTGTPDFRLRLPALGNTSTIPSNLQLVQWGQTNNGGSSNGGSSSASTSTTEDTGEAGRQWEMAHRTHAHAAKVVADNAAIDAMNNPPERVVADVQVGNESVLPKTPTSQGMYVQVREFAPETLDAQKPFIYQLPADTFVHSSEKERIKLSATTGNGANLPRWVKFSAKDRTLSGKPPKWVKSLDVKVMATDRQGARATTRVRLVFANGSGS